jgi:hypothetical protein
MATTRGRRTHEDDRHGAGQEVGLAHGQRENTLRASGALQVALLAAALADTYGRPVEEIRGRKWLWSVVAW